MTIGIDVVTKNQQWIESWNSNDTMTNVSEVVRIIDKYTSPLTVRLNFRL